jgi:hypothetical protein
VLGGLLRPGSGTTNPSGSYLRTEILCYCAVPLGPIRQIHMSGVSHWVAPILHYVLLHKPLCSWWYTHTNSLSLVWHTFAFCVLATPCPCNPAHVKWRAVGTVKCQVATTHHKMAISAVSSPTSSAEASIEILAACNLCIVTLFLMLFFSLLRCNCTAGK